MINCNLTTILYLYLSPPHTHIHTYTHAHTHARARTHTHTHTTRLLFSSLPDIYPTKPHKKIYNPQVLTFFFFFFFLKKKLRNKREIWCNIRDKRRDMSGGNVVFPHRCGLSVIIRTFFFFSRRVRARSRLLCCSVAARGASCLGHMKSISRSQRGAPSRVFIGTEVTKTLLLLCF